MFRWLDLFIDIVDGKEAFCQLTVFFSIYSNVYKV